MREAPSDERKEPLTWVETRGIEPPDLLLANSRPGRRSLSLSTDSAHLAGMRRG